MRFVMGEIEFDIEIMLYNVSLMGYLFHELKNNSNTGVTTFCLILLEKLISPSYQCCFEHEFRFVRVVFFKPQDHFFMLVLLFFYQWISLFLFQHSDYFF